MALKGSGRLPSLANLIDKGPENLIKVLDRFNITPDLKEIDRAANRAFATFSRAVEQGIEPDEHLWAKVDAQHEREMTQTLRVMAKTAIRTYRVDALGKTGEKLIWITRADTKVCISCKPRHGQIRTLAEWRRLGLPGSGFSVCGPEDRCQLVPAGKG